MKKTPDGPRLRAGLLPDGSHWLVGVSGGADSVALLRLLQAQSPDHAWRLTVAHLDHGLRGRAAAADARFVGRLARSLGLPFVQRRADVAALAQAQGWSIEQAAREARLAFFADAARRRRAAGVVLAHTRDDQAETLLIRLLRGAGAQGLAAMRETQDVRGLVLVRPLLRVERSALRRHLAGLGQDWREDASNADPRFLRNRIRHEVIPFLERTLARPVQGALARAAEVLGDEEEMWRERVEAVLRQQADGEGGLRLKPLAAEPLAVQRRVLHQWLWSRTGSGDFDAVERVRALLLETGAPASAEIGAGWRAGVGGGRVFLQQVQPDVALPEVLLIKGRSVKIPAWGLRVVVKRGRGPLPHAPQRLGEVPAQVALSRERGDAAQLAIRSWRAGDRLRPAGGRGSRKLQDIFTDARVPRESRPRVPILAADGAPVWIPGHRPAEGWAVRLADEPAWHIRLHACR